MKAKKKRKKETYHFDSLQIAAPFVMLILCGVRNVVSRPVTSTFPRYLALSANSKALPHPVRISRAWRA
jgi:hypothetical protein